MPADCVMDEVESLLSDYAEVEFLLITRQTKSNSIAVQTKGFVLSEAEVSNGVHLKHTCIRGDILMCKLVHWYMLAAHAFGTGSSVRLNPSSGPLKDLQDKKPC